MTVKQYRIKRTLISVMVLLVLLSLFGAGLLYHQTALAENGGHAGSSTYNEADGNKIESVHLVWNTPDTRDDGEKDFLWLSSSSTTPLSMKFTVQVNLSGQADAGDYAPGSLRIRIPRQIWHKRDTQGEPGSMLEDLYGKMDLPITIRPNANVDWYYEVDGDDYVFINNKQIGATSNHSFECTIYDINPLYIVDESISEQLQAHVDALTSMGNTIWMDSNILQAQIDTSERIVSASKSPKLYEFIDDDNGVPQAVLDRLPSGTPDEYVYVKWTTYSRMSGNQYFSLKMDDPSTWCYDRVLNKETNETEDIPVCQGIFLAETSGHSSVVVGLGDAPEQGKGEIYNDGYSYKNDYVATNTYATESRTITLWAAYPNETFQNGHTYIFKNYDDWTLNEYDPEVEYWEGTDEQLITEADANGSEKLLRMDWVYPPGRFLAFKFIETDRTHKHPYYDSNHNSHKKQHTYEMALNKIRDGKDITMDYELLTVGYGYMFTAGPLTNEVAWEDQYGNEHKAKINDAYDDQWDSEEWIQDPDHFLNWYYVMDTSDRWDFFNYCNRAGGDPQLTGEDYQFDGVYIQAPEMFSYSRQKDSAYRFQQDLPFGYKPDESPEKKPNVELWVEYDNGATIDRESASGNPEGWVYMGEYEVREGCIWVPFDNTTDKGIITGFRTRVTTNEAACKLTVYPRITLKATDRVKGIVEQLFAESGTPSTNFRNDDNLHVELFKTAEDQSIYDPVTNPEGKVHPNQQMFLDEDVYFRQDIWDDSAIAKFTGAGYGITLSKGVAFNPNSIENGGDNDIINKRAILHYTATCTQESNLTSTALYQEAVESGAVKQDYSCVWYDLLPENVQPIVDSVRMVRSGDKVLRVSTIPDYQGTGRIMMIVECELTPSPERFGSTNLVGDRIQLKFDAYITWLDLNAMPDNYEFMNYVAYQSGIEGQVGTIKGKQGEKDTITPAPKLNTSTPGNVPAEIAAVFTDLDPNTDDGRFVYARVPITPRVNMDAHTEYVKYVSSDLEGIWTQGLDGQHQVNVYEGHNYTYRLTVASAKGTNTWDMVFYDSIENYLIPTPDPDDPMQDATKAADYADTREKANWSGDWKEGNGGAPGGQWRGKLYQVDLSELYEMRCKPVLYYSTIPWMQFNDTYGDTVDESVIFNDYNGHYMLEDINTWTPVDMSTLVDGKWNVPEGLEVTAIAVDAKKTIDGEPFVLRSKESVSLYLRMTAPDDQGQEDQWHAKGAYARFTDDAATFGDIDWEAATNPENNMHAFNNTRLISRQAHEDSGMTAFLTMIRNDYTRVGIMPEIKLVEKVWDDDDNHDNLRPDSIVVEMLRKVQFSQGDYEPVINEETGEPVTLEITPVTVQEEVDGVLTEREVWKGIFYQVPVVDDAGRKYLYQFRDTVTGYTCTSAEDSNGRIILTNTHKNETIPIRGEKTWLMPDGSELTEAAKALMPASVKVHLYRTGTSGEEELVKTLTVTPDATGKWFYDFGQQEKYERGGFEYVYSIKEDPVDRFVSSMDGTDNLPEGYEIPFLDSDAYDPDSLEIFHNFFIPYGDLAIQKNIQQATDVSKEHIFQFALSLYQTADPDTPVEGEFDYAIYDVQLNEETGVETLVMPAVETGIISAGGTFQLSGGQRMVIREVPIGTTYAVTEVEKEGWNVPATPGETAKPEVENASGPVKTGQTVEILFTNTYTATGYAQIRAHKTLTGREMKASMFGFELVDNNPDSETYGEVIKTAYSQAPNQTVQDDDGIITSDADVVFGALVYDQSDAGKTFHYLVREKNTGKDGFLYSEAEYEVTVEVTDNGNGTMTTVVTPADPAELEFANTYRAEGELVLRGWKMLQRRDAEDQEFTFELWASDETGAKIGDEPLQSVKNDADSNITFAPIRFDQDMVSVDPEHPFVYYYLMTEKNTGDDNIIYSDYQHLFIVTPQDNGDGTISFDQTEKGFNADGSEADTSVPVFANDVKDGHLKVSKQVINGNAATKFTFKIKLNGVEPGSFDLERGGGSTAGGDEDQEEETPSTSSGIKPVYYAPNELIQGRNAYAALNMNTGELVFFRADPNAPMDPWGNTFTNSGFSSNRKASEDGNFIWYNGFENSIDVHPWTNPSDRLYVKTVTMRDPIRPSSLKYYFQNCSNLVSVSLDKMDLHDASGSVRSISLWSTFENTPNIKEIDLGSLDLSSTSDLDKAFQYCYSLETLNIGHMNRSGSALYSTSYRRYAFQGTKITRITIGDKTNFGSDISVGTWYHYPTPPAGYNDLWINVDTNEQLTSLQLFTQGGHGGTWELDPKYYQITFSANGGTGSMSAKTVNVHREFVTGYNFYKFGCDFAGFRDNFGTFYEVDGNGKVTIPSNAYTEKLTAGETLNVTLSAEWVPVNNTASMTGDTLTVTLYGGESVTIKNIPAYTTYEVWEELPTGWVLVSKSGDSGIIQPQETAECEFTNEYAPNKAAVNLNAYKRMDGELAGGYTFALYKADAEWQPVGDPIDTKVSSAGGIASFDVLSFGAGTAGDHRYVIKEVVEQPDPTIEYDTDWGRVTVTVTDDGQGKMSAVAGYHDDGGVFRNNTKPGSLILSKEIVNATGVSQNQTFTLKVTFFDKQGNPAVLKQGGEVLDALTGKVQTIGQTTETTSTYLLNGSAIMVTLKGNQKVTFEDVIPAGVSYQVEEINIPTGWRLTTSTGETGNITSGGVCEASFTNTYTAQGFIPMAVEKQVAGETPQPSTYQFELYPYMVADLYTNAWTDLGIWDFANQKPFDGQDPLQVVANGERDTRENLPVYVSDTLGSATVPNPEFGASMATFSPVKVTQEGVYLYAIREVPGDDTTMIYDSGVIYAQAFVRDVFGDGRLIPTAVWYFRQGKDDASPVHIGAYGYPDYDSNPLGPIEPDNTVLLSNAIGRINPIYMPWSLYGYGSAAPRTFVNERKDGSLMITKAVTGATEAADGAVFTVSIQLTDATGNPLAGQTYTTTVDGNAGADLVTDANGVGTVSIQDGQCVLVEGLPHGAAYAVTETDLPGGFALDHIDEADGTIVGGEQMDVAVHNNYSATGALTLTAKKVMTPANLRLDEGRFTFEVKNDRGTVIRSAVNGEGGTVTFEPILYTMADVGQTYVYTISEVMGDNLIAEGEESVYATDRAIYQVEVTIADRGDGTLEVTSQLMLNEEEASVALFSNTEKTKVHVTKQWKGDTYHPEKRPTYIILNLYADGEYVLSRAINAERNGTDDANVWSYTFDQLAKYNNGVEIKYTVTEETVEDYYPTIISGDNQFTIVNTYSEASLDFAGTKTLTDHLTGEAAAFADGQFQVRITGKKGTEPLPAESTVDVMADGTFTFGEIPFTVNDLGMDEDGNYHQTNVFTYQISEVIPQNVTGDMIQPETHIRYDATVYEVQVTLSYDPATGALTAQADRETASFAFANESNADCCELTLTAQKTQETRRPAEGEFTFQLKKDGEVIDTATNDADGLVTFSKLTFSAEDLQNVQIVDGKRTAELIYTMSEVNDGIDGIAYDDHVETITVTLTENEDGSLTVEADKVDALRPVFVNRLEPTGIQVTKEWVDMDSEPITLIVGTIENDQFVALDPQPEIVRDNDIYSVDGLPKYDRYGTEIIYAVVEGSQPSHIVRSYRNDNGEDRFALHNGAIINRYTAQGEFVLTGQKTIQGEKPGAEEKFAFVLKDEDGNVLQTVENQEDLILFQPIEYTFEDNGKTFVYTVEESTESDEHYVCDTSVYTVTVTVTDAGNGVMQTQWTLEKNGEAVDTIAFDNIALSTLSITKTVTSVESDSQFAFLITLMDANGQELTDAFPVEGTDVDTIVSGDYLYLKHGETAVISHLPVGTRYRVEEHEYLAYDTTADTAAGHRAEGVVAVCGNTADFVNNRKTVSFTITKEWQGGQGDLITLILYANGVPVEPQPSYQEDNNVYTYTNLPQYTEDGQEIVYSAKEKYMDGFVTIYKNKPPHTSETDRVYDGGTIINRAVTSIRVRKIWRGVADGEGTPDITLILYCNGQKMDKKTPKPTSDGWYIYNNLPYVWNGEVANYTVVEAPVYGYATSYGFSPEGEELTCAHNNGVIVNSRIPMTGDRAPIGLWIACAVVALGGLIGFALLSRKSRKEKE